MSDQHPWKLSWHTVMLQTTWCHDWAGNFQPSVHYVWWRLEESMYLLCVEHFFFFFFSHVHVHTCMHTLYLHVWVALKKELPKYSRCHLLNNNAPFCREAQHLIWVDAQARQFGREAATTWSCGDMLAPSPGSPQHKQRFLFIRVALCYCFVHTFASVLSLTSLWAMSQLSKTCGFSFVQMVKPHQRVNFRSIVLCVLCVVQTTLSLF